MRAMYVCIIYVCMYVCMAWMYSLSDMVGLQPFKTKQFTNAGPELEMCGKRKSCLTTHSRLRSSASVVAVPHGGSKGRFCRSRGQAGGDIGTMVDCARLSRRTPGTVHCHSGCHWWAGTQCKVETSGRSFRTRVQSAQKSGASLSAPSSTAKAA